MAARGLSAEVGVAATLASSLMALAVLRLALVGYSRSHEKCVLDPPSRAPAHGFSAVEPQWWRSRRLELRCVPSDARQCQGTTVPDQHVHFDLLKFPKIRGNQRREGRVACILFALDAVD